MNIVQCGDFYENMVDGILFVVKSTIHTMLSHFFCCHFHLSVFKSIYSYAVDNPSKINDTIKQIVLSSAVSDNVQ